MPDVAKAALRTQTGTSISHYKMASAERLGSGMFKILSIFWLARDVCPSFEAQQFMKNAREPDNY